MKTAKLLDFYFLSENRKYTSENDRLDISSIRSGL